MANIDKELNQIKNAVYGREVRGSIHDGIDKINKETEIATGKADEAHDVMESIINDGFDNAALEANFEQKLENEIANLQPEWTQFKEQTNQQLAETDEQRRTESIIGRRQYNMTNDGEDKTLLISWVDDDGTSHVYDKWKPILEEYNIPLTSGLITDRLINSVTGYYMSVAQTKELHDLGMEFISHSHYHGSASDMPPLNEASPEQIEEEFYKSTKILKDLGYNYRGISLPFGSNNYDIQRLLRKYFDYAIGTASDESKQLPFYPGETSNYYIYRIRAEHGIQHISDILDEALRRDKAWVVLGSHLYEDVFTQDYIREIIETSQNKGFKFVSTKDGMEALGNIAQFGTPRVRSHAMAYSGTMIGADGTITSESLGKVRHLGFNEVKSDTPITYFPSDVISLTRLRTVDAEGFPEDRPGFLTTYRFSSGEGNSYQVYTTSGFKMFFERSWNDSSSSWGEWIRFNYEQFLPKDSVTPEDRAIGEKLRYKITHTIVSSGQPGFPDEKAGTLITYALSWDKYPFQEFYAYQEAKVYKRLWNGDDWSPWYLVQDRVLGTRELPNRITGTTPASEIGEGITMSYISSAASSEGLPIGASTGNLISYIEGDTGRNYQEFRGYASFDKYLRFERSNGEWSDWKKFVMEDV